MKKTVVKANREAMTRLTAILVAVVFALGTVFLPIDLYAAETGTDETESAASEQLTEPVEGEIEDVESAETEAESEEAEITEEVPAEPEAEEPAAEIVAPEADDAVLPESAAPEAVEPEQEPLQPEAEEPDEEVPEIGLTEEMIGLFEATDENGNPIDLEDIDEDAYDGFIYKLEENTSKTEIAEMETAIDELDETQDVSEVIEEELYTADSIETIAEVASADMIEYIEPDYIVTALGTNDPYYKNYGWYLDQINAPYAWGKGVFGDGTVVAVVDSGVRMSHADFEKTKFKAPRNIIKGTQNVTDDTGHGTAVAGIIAASYNNGKGLTGIMPNATIIPVKVLDNNAGTISSLVKGINYAVNNGADVINLSLGGTIDNISLKNACQSAANKKVILVAASGNDGRSTVEYPASYDTVVSVGSVERDGYHSSFSTYNKYVDTTAPGRGILYTGKGGGYGTATGTSFSAPQVAALAVMAKTMEPSMTIKGFRNVLKATAKDKGAAGYDSYYGYGIIDFGKAFRYLAGDIGLYKAYLSTTVYVYNGQVRTPAVTLKRDGRTLAKSKYKVTYPPGRKAVGKYNVTVKGYFNGTKTVSFIIKPPLVKKMKTPKKYKRKLLVRWNAMTAAQKTKYKGSITGYQVRVSKNASFKDAKYRKVKGASTTQAAVKGLKRKTTYYVQYRSYKVVGSVTYYSNWSSKKKTKTK